MLNCDRLDQPGLIINSLLLVSTLAIHLVISVLPAVAQGGPRWHGPPDMWQPGWIQRHIWRRKNADPDIRARMQRHWSFMHGNIPRAYEKANSTVKPTKDVVTAGGKLYRTHCASCHGKSGRGDGDAGNSLSPSPALLAFMIQRPIAADQFLMWTISEGGAEFRTDMPAFKDTLSKDEIWKVIAYMRAGFPAVEK